LQAKRAAYFVQSGDYNSYTRSGTPLAVQDKEAIMNVLMPGAEAVWSPEGAVCFSPEFRRTPRQGFPSLPVLPAVIPVPACEQKIHDAAKAGMLPQVLQSDAPLATGAVVP
jgi:hypothetical protein